MANRRKEIPSFVSIEVGVARSIAEAMTDDEWGKWSKKALDDLSIGCTRKDTDARVRNLYAKAKDNMDKEYLRKKEWYENRKAQGKNPQDAPNGNAGGDVYDTGNRGCLESATSCDKFTADGDTREDSLNISNGRNAGSLESGTSANLYATRQAKNGDASHREAGDESATASNPLALDMPGPDKGRQTAKTRDSYGSSRYQPPSLGPEDGDLFTTKEPSTISANERRTGGSIREAVDPLPPVRQSEPDVLSLAYSGEFGNVRLTQAHYNELGIRFGNLAKLNRAIDSLSCKIENGETNPRNHYAELVKWANYRDDMDERKEEEASKPKMTEMEKSWIAAMKRVEAM